MKGQDIVLLLKLVAMRKRDRAAGDPKDAIPRYSVRGLASSTGISKSEIGLSLQRCFAAGLASRDPKTDIPLPNLPALREFLAHGLRYVFPVTLGSAGWGIPTAWAAAGLGAPVPEDRSLVPVWPTAGGKTQGQAVEPLFASVPDAAAQDAQFYAMLALTDALRLAPAVGREQATQALLALVQ
jgi:hypothetical protein